MDQGDPDRILLPGWFAVGLRGTGLGTGQVARVGHPLSTLYWGVGCGASSVCLPLGCL